MPITDVVVVHDRLKPVPMDEAPKPQGVSTFAVAIALSLLAAGFAFAVPLAAHKTALEPNNPGVPAVSPSASAAPVVVASPTADPDDSKRRDRRGRRGRDGDRGRGGGDGRGGASGGAGRAAGPAKRADRPDGDDNKRTPDSPTDHDKGYGNDPGGPGRDGSPADGDANPDDDRAARDRDDETAGDATTNADQAGDEDAEKDDSERSGGGDKKQD